MYFSVHSILSVFDDPTVISLWLIALNHFLFADIFFKSPTDKADEWFNLNNIWKVLICVYNIL